MCNKRAEYCFAHSVCRYCGKPWRPADNVVATEGYCSDCSKERRSIAGRAFGLRPIEPADIDGPYVIPSAFRRKPQPKNASKP